MSIRVPDWWPPKGSSRQFRWEKWFWASTIPPTVGWAIFFPGSWNRWGVQYVAWLSIYALVKGAGGQEQASEAKEKVGEEGDDQSPGD